MLNICWKLLDAMYCSLSKQMGTDSLAASDMEKTMRYVMRAMPVLILPFMAKFPAVRISRTMFLVSLI